MAKHKKFRRRLIRRRLIRRRGELDMQAIARMRPWSVCITYNIPRQGFSPGCAAFDKMLFAVVGRYSDGSGAGGSRRDHYWACRTHEEARQIAMKLATVPGLESLRLEGNVPDALLLDAIDRAKKEKTLKVFPDGSFGIRHRGYGRRRRRAAKLK